MMLVKLIHVISSAVLFGGVLGASAFFTLAHRTGGAVEGAVAGYCRTAGWLTLVALVVQPTTGMILITLQEDSPAQPWLIMAYILYTAVLLAWIASTVLLTRFARAGVATAPQFRLWAALSWGSVAILCGVYYLMLAQPALWAAAAT
jgi:uncharacterized membrane protein